MSRSLEVLATGPLVLVEDEGRPGHAAVGVPHSGAADRGAHRLGARLVGHDPSLASFEVLLGGLVVRARGRLVVEGRRDLRFKVGGEAVQPEAVERAIVGLPGVREAVVVPVPDAEYGARPFAFVDGDGPPDPRALRAALRERLPGLFVPVGFAALPDGPGLKPSRRALAALAAAHRGKG